MGEYFDVGKCKDDVVYTTHCSHSGAQSINIELENFERKGRSPVLWFR